MADLGGTFDANAVDPSAPQEVYPEGKYLVKITKSEIKETKSGSGKYINFTFEFLDGQYKGRKVFDNLNIINHNKQTEEIARRALSAIAHSTGVMTFRDTSALHDIPLVIYLKVVKRDDKDEFQNIIRGYEARESLAPVAAPVAAPAAQSTGSVDAPPWQR